MGFFFYGLLDLQLFFNAVFDQSCFSMRLPDRFLTGHHDMKGKLDVIAIMMDMIMMRISLITHFRLYNRFHFTHNFL